MILFLFQEQAQEDQIILLKRDVGGKMVMVVEKWRAAVESFGALRSCPVAAIHLSCLLPSSDLSFDLVTAQPSDFVPSPSDYPFGHLTSPSVHRTCELLPIFLISCPVGWLLPCDQSVSESEVA